QVLHRIHGTAVVLERLRLRSAGDGLPQPVPVAMSCGRFWGYDDRLGFLFGGSKESTLQRVQRLFGGFVLAALLSIACLGAGIGSIGGLGVAHAQPLPAQPAPTRPSDAPLPSCLDQTIKDQLGADL